MLIELFQPRLPMPADITKNKLFTKKNTCAIVPSFEYATGRLCRSRVNGTRCIPSRKERTMFQSLDQLITGSLFILTGQAGAGKSHLAARSRRNGTVWILDTEGASKNLLGKPGVHKAIQAVQTL